MVYLRPETAQGMFVDFPTVQTVARQEAARSGSRRSASRFRNEITPGNFIFRTREFEQMEMEFFVEPGTDEEWFDVLGRTSGSSGTWTSASRRTSSACGRTSPTSSRTTRRRPPTSSTSSRSAGASSRASRTAPTSTCGAPGGERPGPDVLRPGERAAVPARTSWSRPVGVDRAAARVPVDAYREERGPDREGRHGEAHRAGAAPRRSRRSRSRCCRCRATRSSCPRPAASTTW